MRKRTLLWFDGAAEPNPGRATFGFVVRENDPPVKGRFLHSGSGLVSPYTTNNVAEYYALGHGLRWLVDAGKTATPLIVYGDSQLVVNQVLGLWECRAAHLQKLLKRCLELFTRFDVREIKWIPREENDQADQLSRSAWESAAGLPFPERPTKRKWLPGQTR